VEGFAAFVAAQLMLRSNDRLQMSRKAAWRSCVRVDIWDIGCPMTSGSKSFGAAFFFGGFALLLAGMQLWFGHGAAATSASIAQRVFEAAMMLIGAGVSTAGVRMLSLARAESLKNDGE
jgi:hypothetical protein